jgi:REP element-mobilizing transposase RayT
LIFDAETPFSTIRSQAGQLARSLAVLPAGDDEENGEEDSPPAAMINNILSDVPPPNPPSEQEPEKPEDGGNRVTKVRDTVRRLFAPAQEDDESGYDPGPHPPTLADTAPMPASGLESGQMEVRSQVEVQTEEDLTVTIKSKPDPMPEPERHVDESDVLDPDAPTVPRKILLEPVSPSVYNLDYVCLLLPRFTHHHLTGDISERMGQWVRQICIAFAWRLEFISVRPEYMLWIAIVPPATSPAYLMRILRQHTSEKIFSDFPRLKKENPSGDFWAPGYLIMGGSQPPPTRLIKDYIAQTRQRQGFSPPNRL